MTNDDFTVYDTVRAYEDLKPGDNVAFVPPNSETTVQDFLTLTKVIDSGESILVTGESWVTGDSATYILPADHEVDLWTV